MSEINKLEISAITVTGGTQARTEINQAVVSEYSDALKNGAIFPPVIVFEDGVSIWLADGFHRFHAHRQAGIEYIECDIRTGTQREAILFSLSANASHGLRRTNEDKRKAVMTLLNDDEWAGWSQNRIAETCGVSSGFVSKLVNEASSIHGEEIKPATRTVERNGKTYEQNTANIGKTTPAPAVEVKQEAKEITQKEIVGQAAPDADYVEEMPDLVAIAEELQEANEALQRENDSLKKDDKDAELSRLNMYVDQLNGRLNGEINTKNEAQKQAKYYADLLAKIRKALNVESNSKILSALGAR